MKRVYNIVVSGERYMAGEPASVFAMLIEPLEQLAWNSLYLDVALVPPGPVRDGSVMTGRFKGAGKSVVTFADVVPGKTFTHLSKLMIANLVRLGTFRHRYEVEADGIGTLVRQTVTVELTLMGRILRPVITSAFSKRLPESFDELAAYAGTSPH